MKIAVIGTGYVGLVTGTCLSELGHDVICVDRDASKIQSLQQGIVTIHEPGLPELVQKNLEIGRLGFSTSLEEGLEGSEAAFVAVGTPAKPGSSSADLTQVREITNRIAQGVSGPLLIVMKSTVPVGTCREIAENFKTHASHKIISVASNPEFLSEGNAVNDFMNPDRIVIGTEDSGSETLLRKIYAPLTKNNVPMLVTDKQSAELIKYASNAFLATKISFINEIADLCETVDANIGLVSRGMGLDSRIGPAFLRPGPGYGGSCFPKDTLAACETAEANNQRLGIVRAAIEVNNARLAAMAQRVINALGGSVTGKRIAILGLTFKAGTDDVRESPSLRIIEALLRAGAVISAYDPAIPPDLKKIPGEILLFDNCYDAISNADAAVVITEWREFQDLDFSKVRRRMAGDQFIDLRLIIDPETVERAGLKYVGLGGRKSRKPALKSEPMPEAAWRCAE